MLAGADALEERSVLRRLVAGVEAAGFAGAPASASDPRSESSESESSLW